MSNTTDLKAVEQRLAELESKLSVLHGRSSSFDTANQNTKISISSKFNRSSTSRKPFILLLESEYQSSKSLSNIRTAIVIILLVELLERTEGVVSNLDFEYRVTKVLDTISTEPTKAPSSDALRVALYRCAEFMEKELQEISSEGVSWKVVNNQLKAFFGNRNIPDKCIDLNITSTDRQISALLDSTLATSPLSKLRKSRAAYIPSGESGQDRLLLELLDHPYPIKQVSLFYRPTIQGYPLELAKKLQLNNARCKRIPIAMQAYQSGRLQYLEVISRKNLRKAFSRVPGKGFLAYPGENGVEQAIQHLDHILFLLRSCPNMELAITDAFMPFYITTFELLRPDEVERYTLFFQYNEEENVRQVSTFCLKDDTVFFSSHDKIIGWVLAHPTTVRSRDKVIAELLEIRDSILNHN